jgi:hypothetical protein
MKRGKSVDFAGVLAAARCERMRALVVLIHVASLLLQFGS